MIDSFDKEYDFLNNDYLCSFQDNLGREFSSVTHYVEAHHTIGEENFEKVRQTSLADLPKLMTKLPLRSDWNYVRYGIVKDGVRKKFIQNPDLMNKLLQTKTEILIYGNKEHDNYWGQCTCLKCGGHFIGKNKLGGILMDLRREYRLIQMDDFINKLILKKEENYD